MKKAVIELQMTWIFGLVAGIIFLIGIGVFVNNQQQATKEAIDSKTLEDLRNTINTMKDANNRVSEFELPRSSILKVSCVAKSLKIGKAESQVGLDTFFAPKELKGKLKIWISETKLPFDIGPTVYLSDDSHFYLFVFENLPGNAFQEKIYADFPESFGKQRTTKANLDSDLAQLKKIKNLYITVIYLYTANNNQGKSESHVIEAAIQASDANGADSIWDTSPVTLVANPSPTHYAMPALIYGTIFSQTKVEWLCAADEIFTRGSQIANILQKRADTLSGQYSVIGYSQCSALMSQGSSEMLSIKNSLSDLAITWNHNPQFVKDARELNQTYHKLLDGGCSNLY